MRKVLLLPLMCTTFAAIGQSLSFGSALVYGDEIDALGVNVRGYFNTADHRMCFGPEFTFFNKSEMEDVADIDISLFEFNLNGHYVFEVSDKLGINPIVGLNYSREEEITMGMGEEEFYEKSAWGLLTGVGFHFFLSEHFFMIGEYDHLFSALSENTFTLGLLYTFQVGKKKHHEPE